MADTNERTEHALEVAKKQGKLWYQIKKSKASYIMIAPYFILFFFFTVLPVAMAVGFSFTYYNMLEMPTFVGWKNYIKLFLEDDIFMKSLKNTLLLAVVTGPVSYMLCLLFAWIINEFKGKLRAFLTLIFYAPSMANVYTVWKLIFSDDANGYLNSFLMYLGIIDENIYWLSDKDYMMGICILVTLWMSMGAGFLSFVAGLKGVDNTQLEAGSIDGIRNRWQELWYIILPSMKPQLLFGAVMSISSAFSIGAVTENLCGMPSTDYAVHTIMNHLTDYGTTRFEMGYASAIATVLFAMMLLTNQLFSKFLERIGQ